MMRLRPITSRLRRRLSGRSLRDVAARREEWAPGSDRPCPSALSLPGELDRAIAFAAGRDRALLAAEFRAHDRAHPPTYAYRLDDVVLADGRAYAAGSFDAVAPGRPRALIRGPVAAVREALLCTDICSSRFFGDWLMTALPLELLAERRGLTPLTLGTPDWPHEEQYRDRAGLPAPARPAQPVRVGTLWMIDDRGMNEDRLARYRTLRARVAAPPRPGGERVLIDRGVRRAPPPRGGPATRGRGRAAGASPRGRSRPATPRWSPPAPRRCAPT